MKISTLLTNQISGFFFSLVVYFILQAVIVDIIDDFLLLDISNEAIDSLQAISFILFAYSLVMFGSFLISSILITGDTVKSLISSIFSIITLIIVIYAFSYISILIEYPVFDLTPSGYASLPLLFFAFVIRNPTVFFFILMLIYVIFNTMFIVILFRNQSN